jgi:glycerophosphoryl diester phosphodiesterase
MRRAARITGLVLLAAVGIALLAQTPPRERIPHFAEHTPANIAHAGAQGHAPANTIEAFDLALELGADTLEMDLQITADDEIVTHHDGTVDRQTDGSGAIRDMTLDEIQRLDAGEGTRIPTLEEVFETFPDTFMVIELKTDGGAAIVEAVAERVEAHDRHDSVVVASFDVDYLRAFRQRLPGVATAMAEDEIRTFYILQRIGLHRWWRPPGEHFHVPEHEGDIHVVVPGLVQAAERLGIDVHVWTVNEPEAMRRLLDAGAHGIFTDYPDVLAEVIDAHPRSRETEPFVQTGRHDAQLTAIRWLQERLDWLEPVMLALTRLGDEEFYVFAFPLLYWSVSRHLIVIGIIFLLSDGLKAALKLGFPSPRPFFLDPGVGRITEASFGIPSGHAQNAVVVWGALAAEVRRAWAWNAAVVLALLIGLSRLYLGVHFAEDLLVGWLVGALVLVAYLRLRAPIGSWLARQHVVGQLAVPLAAALALIGLGAIFRGALAGWAFPAAWVGGHGIDHEAMGLAAVVTPTATLFGLGVGLVVLRLAGGWDTAGPIWQRIARFPIGLVGVVVIWMGLGAVLPGGEDPVALVLRFVRYGLLGAWVAGFAPLLFVRLGLAPAAAATPRER